MKIIAKTGTALFCIGSAYAFAQDTLTIEQKKEKIKTELTELSAMRAETDRLDAKVQHTRAQNICLRSYLSLAKPAKFYVDLATADSSVTGSIAQILSALTAEQLLFGARMEAAIAQALKLPTEAKSLGNSIQTVNTLFAVQAEQEQAMISAEQVALNKLSEASRNLTGVNSNMGRSGLKNCTNLTTEVLQLESSATFWSQILNKAYQRVADASAKRMRLREDLGATLRAWLLTQGSAGTATALGDMVATIDALPKALSFMEKVSNWWFIASGGRGPARGNMYDYYLYEGTLRTLRADLAQAEEFELEAKGMAGTIVADQVLRSVSGPKRHLTEQIADIQKIGWQKQYATQVEITERYYKNEAIFSPQCRLYINRHATALKNITTADQFAVNELGFVDVVKTCIK